jgi:hypothetical protein
MDFYIVIVLKQKISFSSYFKKRLYFPLVSYLFPPKVIILIHITLMENLLVSVK